MPMEIIPGPNFIVATPAAGDSSNKPASTQFVASAVPIAVSSAFATHTVAAFSVLKSADQTNVPSSSFTLVTWDTEVYDIGSNFATNGWTPPAGKVHIDLFLWLTGSLTAGGTGAGAVYKNGSLLRNGLNGNQGAGGVQGLCSFDDIASGTDVYTAEAFIQLASGSGVISSTFSFFNGHWFSA